MAFWVPPPSPFGFWHPVNLVATCFGVGLLRPAPGTWGSLLAVVIAWVLVPSIGQVNFALLTFGVIGVGLLASDRLERAGSDKDPSSVVIDEVAGQWLVLLITPHSLLGYFLAFGLFRLFDILKPWPISLADKNMSGGLGIMLDDLIAGVMGAAVIILIYLYLV